MKEKPWSIEELEFLKENYPAKRAIDVATALNRSKSSIEHKASRLGIHKDERFFPVKSAAMKEAHPRKERRITSKGYVCRYVPDHPCATKNGLVMEHRLVVEEHIGHYLDKDMDVHHINGIKDDNRIENLMVLTHSEHTILHNIGGRR